VFSGVLSFFKKDAEVPGDYWSGVIIADEVDIIEDKESGPTTIPYFLEYYPHSVFGNFLNRKKLVRGSNPHLSFNHPLPTG
jgi:hypothetical protein